ncbi:LCP family protein [Clostridiales bacterium BAD-6]|uniref:LCP family protein n=1 Tax=Sinanaerobacter chloroacetimidivorans TaxID=2818044 RepID=A0A8J8B2Q8_9FIRM|nr:LCP family protein [Sinanaerobacter chloroacetimidivorans]
MRVFSGTENLMDDMPYLVDKNSPFFEAFKDKNRVNVLLIGVNDGMTDTLMLGSYDLDAQHVDIISVPRDTYYPRDGVTSPAAKKINSIYHNEENGKALGTAMAVSDVLMGMPINYYAVVEYDTVRKVVDSMGGVPMNITFHMHYNDPYDTPPLKIDIPEGYQILNGDKAVEFLRFRKGSNGYSGYPEGDIGRIKAQQEFVKSAFRQALGFSLPKVTKTVIENVDSDLPIGMAAKIAAKAVGLSGEDLEAYLLPGESGTKDGASYWYPDEDDIEKMLTQIYNMEPETGSDTETEKE